MANEASYDELRAALLLLLDHVDYESGACRVNEMVGGVLPREVLLMVKSVLARTRTPEGGQRG